jgi:hypothetical protein
MAVSGTQKTHLTTLTSLLTTIENTCVRSDEDQEALWKTCRRFRKELDQTKSFTRSIR